MSATTPPPAATPDDAKDKTPDDDSLGYDAYAKTLWARIEQALNRDATTGKLGDDPLVVGIFGEWGAGKSFLLNAIRNLSVARLAEQKARRDDDPGDMLTIPVWFQAWKYEHEEYLHVPLLLHVMNALKDALREPPTLAAKTVDIASNAVDVVEKIAKPTGKLLKAANAAFPIVQKILGSVSLFGFQLNIPDELGEWLETAAGAAEGASDDKKDDAADKKKKADKERKDPKSHVTTATRDGLYFYRIHELLAALTRPGKYEGRKDLFGSAKLTKETRISFVIFVDDLDRCLPEKAVAVLELIKTVFNVESFAFVLALDDEVIERGISHRYKDYAFGNKKSDMPITGFEYLEKIVHLPFRLPALTRDDALLFIKQKELKLRDSMTPEQRAAYGNALWFSGYRVRRLSSSGEEAAQVLDLSHMLVNSFDAYVPRKLDRAVELFHHVAHVATERGRPIGVSKGTGDIRIVLALVLIQLFQPELFRCLRRTGTGFDQLRDAFKNGRLSSLASDYELLDWACYGPERRANAAAVEKLKDKVTESITGVPTEQTERGALNHAAIQNRAALLPTSLSATTKIIANLEASLRHSSQRVRLPIVERMLEHRAAQRHVFDVLKLFAALQASSAVLTLSEESVQPYFSWLALNLSTNSSATLPTVEAMAASERAPAGETISKDKSPTQSVNVEGIGSATLGQLTGVATASNRVRLAEVAAVFSALTSLEPREQAEVVSRAGLLAGQIIDGKSAADLRGRVENWLGERGGPSSSPGETGKKQILLHGLQYLAPHLAPEDAASFWALVADSVVLPTKPNELAEKPELAALYGDVRAALGRDTRFDKKRPYLLADRFTGHTESDEPLPGFVRIPAGVFALGRTDEGYDPPRVNFSIDPQFYIARTLTTVAQYARFIAGKGYESGVNIWGKQGLEWRSGAFDAKPSSKPTEGRDKARKPVSHSMPGEWDAQRHHASRPVTGITWFEARAYARWLDAEMRADLLGAGLADYAVSLPTEPQWERAARAQSSTEAHDGRWPWGDEAKTAPQRANIDASGIGHVSSVGVFAPNAIGLYDIAGNAWQWMDNRSQPSERETFAPVKRDATLDNVLLSLCGGSWFDSPVYASCSSRSGYRPVDCFNYVGVRVVLSLAKNEA